MIPILIISPQYISLLLKRNLVKKKKVIISFIIRVNPKKLHSGAVDECRRQVGRECTLRKHFKRGWGRDKSCLNNREQMGEDIWALVALY